MTSSSSRLAEREPAEVRLRLGRLDPQLAQPIGDRDALGDGSGHAILDRVLVGERLHRRGLRERVAEERLAHLVDGARQIL